MKIHVIKKFKAGHTYEYDYVKIDLFCPACGTKNLYEECGEGDYYQGSGIVCTSCLSQMYSAGMPSPLDEGASLAEIDEWDMDVITQIKTQVSQH